MPRRRFLPQGSTTAREELAHLKAKEAELELLAKLEERARTQAATLMEEKKETMKPNRTDLAELKNVELFATGKWGGKQWEFLDLVNMWSNFRKLEGVHKVPLKLGHDDRQVLAQADGAPALGWLSRLQVIGQKLVGDFTDVPRELMSAINAGRYKTVSLELYPEWKETNAEHNLHTGVTGPVVSAVAILGADIPEVRGLADLPRLAASEVDRTRRVDFAVAGGTIVLGGFDPSVAADVGQLAHTMMDEVEAVIQEAGLNRENEADRRRALRIAIRLRPDLDPGPADRERIVTEWARNGAPPMAASEDRVAVRMREIAAAERIDLADPAERRALAERVAEDRELMRESEFGARHWRAVAMSEYGEKTWRLFEQEASRSGERLDNKYDLERVRNRVFRERTELLDVRTAPTFRMAQEAIARRDHLHLDRPEDRRTAALRVAAERRDLCEDHARRDVQEREQAAAQQLRLKEQAAADHDTAWYSSALATELERRGMNRPAPTASEAECKRFHEVVEFVIAAHQEAVRFHYVRAA
jgi:hypothetical protein